MIQSSTHPIKPCAPLTSILLYHRMMIVVQNDPLSTITTVRPFTRWLVVASRLLIILASRLLIILGSWQFMLNIWTSWRLVVLLIGLLIITTRCRFMPLRSPWIMSRIVTSVWTIIMVPWCRIILISRVVVELSRIVSTGRGVMVWVILGGGVVLLRRSVARMVLRWHRG